MNKGQEPGNPSMTAGRTLPWLQDVDADGNTKSDVWYDLWNVTYRDVVILDGSNAKVGVYNVTVHDLATPENYATLREMVVDAAMANQKPWRNPDNPLDVDKSQSVFPLDALVIINRLNSTGPQDLPPPTTSQLTPPFYDCNGDNQVTALDALQVVNFLNGVSSVSAGEGEGDDSATDAAIEALGVPTTDSPVSMSGSPQPDPWNPHPSRQHLETTKRSRPARRRGPTASILRWLLPPMLAGNRPPPCRCGGRHPVPGTRTTGLICKRNSNTCRTASDLPHPAKKCRHQVVLPGSGSRKVRVAKANVSTVKELIGIRMAAISGPITPVIANPAASAL